MQQFRPCELAAPRPRLARRVELVDCLSGLGKVLHRLPSPPWDRPTAALPHRRRRFARGTERILTRPPPVEISTGLLSLTLPAPSGAVPVGFSGGMNKADIHRPEGVAAQLRVTGGAAGLTLDRSSLAGLAGEPACGRPTTATGPPAYDFEVLGAPRG